MQHTALSQQAALSAASLPASRAAGRRWGDAELHPRPGGQRQHACVGKPASGLPMEKQHGGGKKKKKKANNTPK